MRWRQTGQADRMAEAGTLAQSLLARFGPELPLGERQDAGLFDSGYHWRLSSRRFGDSNDRQQWPLSAYKVSVEVGWQDGFRERSYTLTTLRLGPEGGGTMTADPRDSEAGFTLVELLVALALFSLLCTLLFGNVRFGMRAWQYGAAHAEQVDHTMVVQGVLRRLIEEAYPIFLAGDPTHPHVDFNGKQPSLEFLSSAPTRPARDRDTDFSSLPIRSRDGRIS
jgi:prepilin-type N-terminal cleavage/methylation domain-containing protein